MKKYTLATIAISSAVTLFLMACAPPSNPPVTVENFDKVRYAGEWHEIARLPNRFEKDVVAAKATYGIRDDGTLSVKNEGLKSNGKETEISGKATIPNSAIPSKLEVRFDRFPANLFAGDYWVLAVNSEYTRAMVGSPNLKYLWLLSKNPDDQKKDFADFLNKAEEQGFDTETIITNPKRL